MMPYAAASDAMLVERIAALGDKAALGELDARHGLTLYAIAYSLLLDSGAADVAVATVLREVWHSAASFSQRHLSVRRWLGELTRRAAHVPGARRGTGAL
jgi:DNA-directed RNA polymerase specialized sigma24 family protein